MNKTERIRYGSLGIGAVLAIPGQLVLGTGNALMYAALVIAAGLFWTSNGWKARTVAGLIAGVGVALSAFDPHICSTGARLRVIYEKAAGHLPYIGWNEVRASVTGACRDPQRDSGKSVHDLDEASPLSKTWRRFDTPLGKFWADQRDRDLLVWLVWEETVEASYEYKGVKIRAGDTVVDCGAHVGTFTRYALSHGAKQVIAVEPDPKNTALIEANFADEIAAGRVRLVKAGVWDRHDTIEFTQDDNSARGSFVKAQGGNKIKVPVKPLDEIVQELGVERVDFIKMDIEGAERKALAGAKDTIRNHAPRMAICTYHLIDDPEAIPAVVAKLRPSYQLYAKDFETGPTRYITKVVFFDPARQ